VHLRVRQGQAISGVFSVASQRSLQYLPDVVQHEQTGCAHFSPFPSPYFSPEERVRPYSFSNLSKKER
jgi:hypothetical protein